MQVPPLRRSGSKHYEHWVALELAMKLQFLHPVEQYAQVLLFVFSTVPFGHKVRHWPAINTEGLLHVAQLYGDPLVQVAQLESQFEHCPVEITLY